MQELIQNIVQWLHGMGIHPNADTAAAVGHAVGAVVFGQSVDLQEWVHDCFRASVLRVRSMMGRRPAAMRARAGAAASRHSPSEVNS